MIASLGMYIYRGQKHAHIRVFPKIDLSANINRIILVENTIGSVVELNFC